MLVSNIGCENGDVNDDTMYASVPTSTVDTIARLAFCSSPTLNLKMVEVDLQKNSSDCGVLSIAIAFDIMSKLAPCVAPYDSKLIRSHLCQCLENCTFTPFPVLGERSVTGIRYKFTTEVELFCVCRLPEHPGEENMAECESCEEWFHQKCQDIPDDVFDKDICASWKCHKCKDT